MPTLDPSNTQLQTYQGVANTAGPYLNLANILQPAYGQLGLSNLQQQLFGYTTGQPGTIGYPATPPGGFVGDPNYGNYGGAPTVGPLQGGGAPTGIEPAAGSFNPFLSGGSTGAGAPGNTVYSPDQGSLIGLGPDRTFNDPYAGMVGPAQAGPQYHPGVLGLNTTALGAYGPAATQALLQSNPYLFDALNLQNNAAFNAATPTALQGQLNQNAFGRSPILSQLNQQAQDQLALNGQLSPQQQHDLGQLTSSMLAPGTQGPQSLVAQLFARDAATQKHMQAAQAFGSNVEGLNQTQNQFGLNVQQGNLAQQGLAGSLAQGAASTASSALTNPILQILGLGSLNSNANPGQSIQDQSSLFNPFMQAGLDIAGANFNAQNAQNIADQNSDSALTSGLLSLGGSVVGGFLSDERIKSSIKTVGKSPSGIPIKEFIYKTDPYKRKWKGAMAQDVKKFNPYAVHTDPMTGMKSVDYSQIDVQMEAA